MGSPKEEESLTDKLPMCVKNKKKVPEQTLEENKREKKKGFPIKRWKKTKGKKRFPIKIGRKQKGNV